VFSVCLGGSKRVNQLISSLSSSSSSSSMVSALGAMDGVRWKLLVGCKVTLVLTLDPRCMLPLDWYERALAAWAAPEAALLKLPVTQPLLAPKADVAAALRMKEKAKSHVREIERVRGWMEECVKEVWAHPWTNQSSLT
jgi:hypothetical protein